MTEGVFEVAGVYDNTLDRENVLEYAALAESSSSHPIAGATEGIWKGNRQNPRDRR